MIYVSNYITSTYDDNELMKVVLALTVINKHHKSIHEEEIDGTNIFHSQSRRSVASHIEETDDISSCQNNKNQQAPVNMKSISMNIQKEHHLATSQCKTKNIGRKIGEEKHSINSNIPRDSNNIITYDVRLSASRRKHTQQASQ